MFIRAAKDFEQPQRTHSEKTISGSVQNNRRKTIHYFIITTKYKIFVMWWVVVKYTLMRDKTTGLTVDDEY